ncbi:MAG TPA: DnaD domain protein [Erysipelotrichaceae bacterium]|nr:DnaD domain protein [Erysipelotrichaceae bacterium]
MITEAIDFRFLLLENYKKLKISESQLVIIMMIDHLLSQGNPFITADLLSLKMSLDVKKIDSLIADLLTQGYLEYTTVNGKTVTTLKPLKEKLYSEFQISISKENTVNKNEKINRELNNIFKSFQDELGRTLSPLEISRIREWVTLGYSDEVIIDALKEALSKGKKSLRSVDKVLLSWAKRDELESEGKTVIRDDWSTNLAETIRIAKTPWLDDDEK